MKSRVILVGGMPEPSGGVTVFLGRLVHALGDFVDFHILDINPGKKIPNKSITHHVLPSNTVLRFLSIAWWIRWISADILHLHYSNPSSVLSLYIFPFLNKKIHLTLHNGNLTERYEKLSPWYKFLIKRAFRGIDKIYAISEKQMAFYELMGVKGSELVQIKTHLPPISVSPAYVDRRHEKLEKRLDHIIVASGHMDRDYNYEFIIRFLNENSNIGALLFAYGRWMDVDYLAELKALLVRSDQLCLYEHCSESVFLAALQKCSAYVRPNSVDSWGVAVADSILSGIPAVASNTCERYPGALLFPTGDYDSFQAQIKAALSGKKIHIIEPTTTDFSKVFLDEYRR